MFSTTVVTPGDPFDLLSLQDAKDELDVDHNEDDALITAHISSAIDYVQAYTNRILIPTTLDIYMDALPPVVSLPVAPVQSVTSLTSTDAAGTATPIASFRSVPSEPFRLLPAIGSVFPSPAGYVGSVVARVEAGYAAGTCPASLVQAVRTLLNVFYDKPGATVEYSAESYIETAERLAHPHRIVSL